MSNILTAKLLKDPNYLSSDDLITGVDKNDNPVYSDRTLTISKIIQEDVIDMELVRTNKKNSDGKQTAKKYVLHFKEPNVKPYVVSATCVIASIQKATGTKIVMREDNTGGWIGKQIIFYVLKNQKFFGTVTDVLRVRDYKPTEPLKFKCADCGAETDETTKVRTTKMFGKCLCKSCGNKAYAEQKASQETVTEQVTETVEDMADVPS